MEEINKAMQELTGEDRTQFNTIMCKLSEDMKNVQMDSVRMAHEAETAAACAFLNC